MGARILLAESVQAYREAVAHGLAQLGHDVTEADNAGHARELIGECSFDLLLIDNQLPDTSGKDLVPELRDTCQIVKIMLVVEPLFDMDGAEDFCKKNRLSKMVEGPLHPLAYAKHVESILRGRAEGQLVRRGKVQDSDLLPPPEPPAHEDDASQDHVTAVRRAYQKKLPGELATLERLLFEAQSDPSDLEKLRECHRIAHTVHGTAGTLGFAEVSKAAGDIEAICKHLLKGKEAPSGSLWQGVFGLLEKAQTAPERPSLIIQEPTTRMATGIATILIVDNDTDSLRALEEIGKKNLVTVIGAAHIEQAMLIAKEKRPDGAIIDIDFDGREGSTKLLQKLRTLEGMSDLPVAFMSSETTITERTVAAHAGASQFLQKPLNSDDIVDIARYFTAVRTSTSSKIVVVDDDEIFRAHIAAILRQEGMEVTTLGDPEQVLEVVETLRPDIVLLDVIMPGVNGFDVCRMLRSTQSGKDVPILFLTAESDPDVRVECFRAGGDDYIEKPVIKEELLARIGVRLERIRLFKERADRDALTNLPNRRAFLELLRLRITEGQRYDRQVSLCLMDIDKFKHVNDTYGHLAGDRVLTGLGKLLASRFRAVDVRGRWGGEEFSVAFYGEPSEMAKMILGRVLEEFRLITFEGDHGEKFQCTFSAGVATFPQDGSTTDDLFRVADEKLYRAKESGRNRIEI